MLISGSLRAIAKSFNINIEKGRFPYEFAREKTLNYIGPSPSGHMKIWKFKEEALKYNTIDTEILYEIIFQFRKSVWLEHAVDVTKCVTVSRLAIHIYLTNYYDPENKGFIYHISGRLEDCVRRAYYGGITEVYIKEVEDYYYYDIVRQYPNAILQDIPIGKPIGIGKVEKLEGFFGFVYCDVIAPNEDTLKIPILPRRVIENNLSSTVTGRGEWSGWYFSEELKYAETCGYIIKPITGIKFVRGKDIFKSYIDHFFKIKNRSEGVYKAFAKIMLNCLYGRWGINERVENIEIVPRRTTGDILYPYRIVSHVNDEYDLVVKKTQMNREIFKVLRKADMSENKNKGRSKKYGITTAIHISAAIARYARISINKFKNIPGNNVAYTDTDSVVIQHPLPENEVGLDIGQMKFEYKISKGSFIRKKFYGIETDSGQKIIKCSGAKNVT